jgi:hypothetical protein
MVNALFPALTAVDGLFASFLPALLRVLVWGGIAGALAMWVYKLTSNQAAIARLKAETRDLRRRMLDPDLEQAEFARLIRVNLKASFSLLGKTVLPGMLSTLPVLLIAAWLNAFYAYAVPPDGEPVRLHVEPQVTAVAIEPANRIAGREGTDWTIRSPLADETLTIVAAGVTAYAGNPFAPPVPEITKRQWWNTLLASEVGYLNPEASIDQIVIDLPPRRLIGGLPDWLAGWEAPYFLGILVVAVALKFGLKIE